MPARVATRTPTEPPPASRSSRSHARSRGESRQALHHEAPSPLRSLEGDQLQMLELARSLQAYLEGLSGPSACAPGRLEALSRSLRCHVEWRHADKLEHELLPWLARRGFDWDSPASRRCSELHALARQAIEALSHGAEREPDWSCEALRRLKSHARDLCNVLQELSRLLVTAIFPEVARRTDPCASRELALALERCNRHSEVDGGATAPGPASRGDSARHWRVSPSTGIVSALLVPGGAD